MKKRPFFEDVQGWRGKRITYADIFKAPWGHTAGCLILLAFDDGSRIVLAGHQYSSPIWSFNDFTPEEMKKHPGFFTPDDIANTVRSQEEASRRHTADAKEQRRRQFEQLQKEFG